MHGSFIYRRELKSKATFESGPSISQFQEHRSRRFQHGFHRLNRQRLTLKEAMPVCTKRRNMSHSAV